VKATRKSAAPRRKRQPRTPVKIPEPFKMYDYVKVSVGTHFKGFKLGIIEGMCKSGEIAVYLVDDTLITRHACVDTERGDTIVKITKS
jgi:hypothetical protein